MKDSNKRNAQKGKKAYLKPKIQQIQLKPDEAVLGGCKTTTIAGPARPTCDFGVGTCRALGTS